MIEDDIYGELYFGKNRPRTCKYYDRKGLVMHCSSLSKSLAPGYRIGWILPGKFLPAIKQLKMMHTVSTPTLTQAAMAHFLSIGRYEYHLKNLRRALHTQCMRYTQAIMHYFPADTKISRPLGGFVLWVELNKKINAYKLCTEALKHHISVAPGQIFSANSNYSNYVRISYGRPWNEEVEYGVKEGPGDSRGVSLEMFRQGKSTQEIAAARNLSVGTVESHLASFVLTGELGISELVPERKLSRIMNVVEEIGGNAAFPIKERLGDDYTYGEIRAVMNHFTRIGANQTVNSRK